MVVRLEIYMRLSVIGRALQIELNYSSRSFVDTCHHPKDILMPTCVNCKISPKTMSIKLVSLIISYFKLDIKACL